MRTLKAHGDSAVFEIERRNAGFTEKCAMKAVAVFEDALQSSNPGAIAGEDAEKRKQRLIDAALEEVRMMIALQSSANIVRYFDHELIEWTEAGRTGVDLLIREELLKPVSSIVEDGGRLGADEAEALAHDITAALKACHDAGIYHRDVKPSNIFENAEGRYKLGDLGSAARMKTDHAPIPATALYAPPELLNGTAGAYEPSADIYSLGLTLYELVAGRLPFENSRFPDGASVKKRLAGESIPAPTGASSHLGQVIVRACSFAPKDRYGSADELLLALDRDEQARDGRAGDKPATATRKSFGRLPIMLAAALVLAAAILLPVIIIGSTVNKGAAFSEAAMAFTKEPAPDNGEGSAELNGPETVPLKTPEQEQTAAPTAEPAPKPTSVPLNGIAEFNNKDFEEYLKKTGQIGEQETYGSLNSILSLLIIGYQFENSGDLSDIAKFTNLETIEIIYCGRLELSWFEGLKRLNAIEVDYTPIADIEAMPELPKLKYLMLRDAGIFDLDFVKKLPALETLDLGSNSIRDISCIKALTHLKAFSIGDNYVRDLSPLAGLNSLEYIFVGSNPIQTLSALSELPRLTELRCDACGLHSIDLDAGILSGLVVFSFSDNSVSDVSPLRSAQSLKSVLLQNNAVSDLSVFFELPLLNSCAFEGNPVQKDQAEALDALMEERFAQDDTMIGQ